MPITSATLTASTQSSRDEQYSSSSSSSQFFMKTPTTSCPAVSTARQRPRNRRRRRQARRRCVVGSCRYSTVRGRKTKKQGESPCPVSAEKELLLDGFGLLGCFMVRLVFRLLCGLLVSLCLLVRRLLVSLCLVRGSSLVRGSLVRGSSRCCTGSRAVCDAATAVNETAANAAAIRDASISLLIQVFL